MPLEGELKGVYGEIGRSYIRFLYDYQRRHIRFIIELNLKFSLLNFNLGEETFRMLVVVSCNLEVVIFTLCLDNIFEEKRKGGKGKEEKGKEGKRNGRKIALVCIGGNGRERKEDKNFLFKSFQF